MAKTYLPQLLVLLVVLDKYMTRYDARIRATLTGEALTQYNTVRTQIAAMRAIFPLLPLGD